LACFAAFYGGECGNATVKIVGKSSHSLGGQLIYALCAEKDIFLMFAS